MLEKMSNFAPNKCEMLMITEKDILQFKAFARQDGALLALLWVCAFLLYIVGLSNSMLALAALMLVCYTPLFVGKRVGKYRDTVLDGVISYRRAYGYTVLMFYYGSILFAVAQYVYFAFLDQGFLLSRFTDMVSSDEGRQVLQRYGMVETMDESLRQMALTRPIDFALNMLIANVAAGLVLGIPVASIRARRVKSE
jgi:hypothetical protein